MRISLRGVGLRFCGFVFLLGLFSSPVVSQGARRGSDTAQNTQAVAVPNRISPASDWSRRVPLRNHLPLWANAQNSTGAASADMTLNMVLSRSPEEQAALDQLLADQKNPASPEFHHWLTPTEFGQRFGLSQSDIQTISNWLVAQGLRIHYVSPSRTFIGFGGSAAAVGQAFGTEIRNYSVKGEARVSVSSDPLIPAALAPVVKAIHGLYTIDDRPQHIMTEPQASGPNLTLANGANYITPGDFNIIYDSEPQFYGAGQTIGIVGRSRTDFDDFTNFFARTSAPLQTPTEIVPTAFGGIDPGPAYTLPPSQGVSLSEQSEATLDVTRAGTIASWAAIDLVVATSASGGIEADAQYLVQTTPLPAQIINISYGACEAKAGPSGVTFWDTLFEQADAEGISVFVSSGDSGAAGCEQAFTAPVVSPPAISPNYICSSSHATCVGGTQFNDTSDPSKYWRTDGGSNLSSANSYIPEGGWNEPTNSSGGTQVAGSGGGVSSVIPTPKWQTGTGVPAARAGRYTPDVSFNASCHTPYFACLSAAGASCVPDSSGSFRFVGFCGTSASAPSMAGVAAVVNERMQFRQGNVNPEIYAMALNQPSSFHDTTPSSSGVTNCDVHTPSICNNSTPGPTGLTGGQAGYPVTTGYDMVTGVGSVDVANFRSNFATALPQPSITVKSSPDPISQVDQATIIVTVAGASGQPTPTGTIKFSNENYNPADATLSKGTATFVVPPLALITPGFTALYTPDDASAAVYEGALITGSLDITPISATIKIDLAQSTVSTAQDVPVTVTVAGPSGAPVPTGNVSLSAGPDGGVDTWGVTEALSGGSAKFTVPAGAMPAGADSIGAAYNPDDAGYKYYQPIYKAASITVTQAPKTTPTVKITASPTSAPHGTSVTLKINVVPASGGSTPTGSVTFQDAYPITQILSGGTAEIDTLAGQLPIGTDTVTVNYPGDANNNAASGSTTVTITKAIPGIKITPASSTITPDQSLTVQVELDPAMGTDYPTGSVTLTCGTYTSASTAVVNQFANITIPGGSLATGTDTLTVSYSGDGNYAAASGTATVTVNAVPPGLTVAGTNVTIGTAGATTGNTSTITLTPAGGFTGSVSLTAAVTTSPAGAQNPPTVSFGSTSPVTISTAAVHATLTITTTPTTTSALVPPPPTHRSWFPAGGTALGLLVLFGIPSRRRKLRAWLGMVLLFAGVSIGMTACSGGSSSTPPPPVTHPGTTAGTYVVTVTATSGAVSAKTTVQVVVD